MASREEVANGGGEYRDVERARHRGVVQHVHRKRDVDALLLTTAAEVAQPNLEVQLRDHTEVIGGS
jgi:hypothetical protein